MSINIQKINDIVKDSEEINNILSSKKNVTNEIIIRVSDINNDVNTLITKLEELNIELNRNRIIIFFTPYFFIAPLPPPDPHPPY